jgi:biopolymer transport protein TolQ
MTSLSILAAATSAIGVPTRLNPVKLFLEADIVVQVVMVGLILASVWVWMIIVAFWLRMGSVNRRCAAYEQEFWEAEGADLLKAERPRGDAPTARVAAAGINEWKRSLAAKVQDRAGLRERLAASMGSTIAHEADKLADRLNFLATVGAVAPFVGLFGTVWGIMNSFFQIGQQQNSSLAVVAPGISEALFATAIGLFAAIPAVIAYNRFARDIDRIAIQLETFIEEFSNILQRNVAPH